MGKSKTYRNGDRVIVTADDGTRAGYTVWIGGEHVELLPCTAGDVASSRYAHVDYAYSHGGAMFRAACNRASKIRDEQVAMPISVVF